MDHFAGSNAELDLCPSRVSEEYYVTNRDDLYDRGPAVHIRDDQQSMMTDIRMKRIATLPINKNRSVHIQIG
jgi:hypothetical protein